MANKTLAGQLRRAARALRLEVPPAVADDVSGIVEETIKAYSIVIRKYSMHHPSCSKVGGRLGGTDRTCTCGLDEAATLLGVDWVEGT